MTNRKITRRALIASLISLMLCVSMLAGSTIAWFTDNASTGVNQIQSGTLSIDLLDANGESLNGKTISFIDKDENALWEPGCTYTTEEITIKNTGNLTLVYTVAVTGIIGNAKLNEAIDWTFNGDGVNVGTGKVLAPGASTTFSISGHMKEDAGNEYQNLTIDGISITVNAYQTTAEKDSFDEKYDEDAILEANPNPVKNISAGFVSYDEATKTYTIVATGSTVDYVGATIDLTEGYDAAATSCRWTYTKADGTDVDETWLIETERASSFIQNINGREIYQLWIRPDSIVTYYFDMNGDGTADVTVVFNAMNATKN